MNAIDASTSSARMTCGHTFHFGCMATWANTNPSCPLCRHRFEETDAIQHPNLDPILDDNGQSRLRIITGGYGRTGVQDLLNSFIDTPPTFRPTIESRRVTLDDLYGARRELLCPRIRRELDRRYRDRPLEDVDYTSPDTIDIDMVTEHSNVSRETAERYLAYFKGDVVETIMCFASSSNDLPIPEFRTRERPTLEEPYVSRDIHNRIGTTSLTCTFYDEGYETS